MIKGKSPKLLLALLASASLTFSMISCGDDEKKDDPAPTNNPSIPTCTTLELTKFTNKTWYVENTNGQQWVNFNSNETWTSSPNLMFSQQANGKWWHTSNCSVNIVWLNGTAMTNNGTSSVKAIDDTHMVLYHNNNDIKLSTTK